KREEKKEEGEVKKKGREEREAEDKQKGSQRVERRGKKNERGKEKHRLMRRIRQEDAKVGNAGGIKGELKAGHQHH
ncbi:hypothetical protein AB4M04_25655, partial [Serratia quinivorans]